MRFFRTIFFPAVLLLLLSAGQQVYAFAGVSAAQVTQQQDTTTKPVPGNKKPEVKPADTKIEYSAVDSTKFSKDKSIIYLYGKARVIYQSFELDADYIQYNSKTNTVFASGRKDDRGKYVGKPIFKMEKQGSSVADSLFYNTKTGKGTVFNTFTEQEGGFFSGGQSKRQPDNEIHVKGVTYSTCNLPHPHFGIYISKGIVTDKQIISGPLYLKIEDIPLPVGLPFAFFPKPNKRSSGVIMPDFGDDYTRGFFIRNGGYYMMLNDYWDAKVLGTVFTRGSYGASITSNYVKRYKYRGSIKVDYNSNRNGVEGTPQYTPLKDYSIQWQHTQDANAHPGTNFSANVNIKTSGYNKNTAGGNTYNPLILTENSLSSGISYSKNFSNGINYSVSASHNQNTANKTVDVTLPEFRLAVPSFSPFDSKTRVGEQKWYQKITTQYTLETRNSISTYDSLLFSHDTFKKLRNGFQQTVPVSLNFTALKYFNFNAGGTYIERWHFQSVRQTAVKGVLVNGVVQPYTLITDTVQGFNRSGQYNFNMGVSTKIYNTLQFKNTGKLRALRLLMTPSMNFSYTPDFSDPSKGNYKELYYQDGTAVWDATYNRIKRYSIHQGSLYGGPGEGQSAVLSFGLGNTLEAKVRSAKDTTGSGVRKVPIIQGLNFNGSYNFLAPSFKLSSLTFSGRSQLSDKLILNYGGTLNPYAVRDSILGGEVVGKKLIDSYTIPRLTNFNLSFGYSLNPEALKKKNENLDKLADKTTKTGMTPEQAAQLAAISTDPNAFVDFKIPWNFAFNYSLNYSRAATGLNSSLVNTLNFNGDLNVTPKWKVVYTSGYDFQNHALSLTRIDIYRDLHCWDMNISWVPIGTYRSYSFTIRVKASILQDLKLSKQQANYTRF